MKKNVLFDRIKLQLNIANMPNFKKIDEVLRKHAKKYIKKTNNFNSYFYLKFSCFNLYYFSYKKLIIIDFNIQKFFYNANVGIITEKEVLKAILIINKILRKIGINSDIRDWVVNSVELKQDIKYKNKLQMNKILETVKKSEFCNMKTKHYSSSYYRHNRGFKVCVYEKEAELKAHSVWSRMDIEEQINAHNTLRFEVEFRQKKLQKMMHLDKVLFKNVLCVNTQHSLFTEFFERKMCIFTDKILLKNNLLQKIDRIEIGELQKKNLKDFVLFLNNNCLQVTKKKYKSTTYKYLKILKENGLNPYFVNICASDFKKVTRKKIIFRAVKKINVVTYNIYTLFIYPLKT